MDKENWPAKEPVEDRYCPLPCLPWPLEEKNSIGKWMKIKDSSILAPALVMASLLVGHGIAQTPGAASAPPAAPQSIQTASTIMQPALDEVLRATGDLSPEHWRTSNAMRQETAANIDSIRRDLTGSLPSLLNAADRAPNSVAQILPAYRNVEALYDVLLRVTETSRMSASKQQTAALEQALNELEGARRALGERMQTVAVAREQRVHDLEAAARAAEAAPKPVAAPCTSATTHTVKHRTRRRTAKKTAAKSATSSTGSQTGTASH